MAKVQMAEMQAKSEARRRAQEQAAAGAQGAERVVGLLGDPRQKAVVRGLLSAGKPAEAIKTAQSFLGLGERQGERRIVKGVDGRNYYADTQQPVLPGVQAPPADPTKRRIVKDAAGTQRYTDTGEPVFPSVAPPAEVAPTAKLTDISSLRREFTGESKFWQQTRRAYEKLSSARPSAAGDISLVFAFMKMIDPTSTVREGEAATIEKAAGVPAVIRNQYNKIITGQRLTPEQRADFKAQGKTYLDNALREQVAREGQYRGIATRSEIDPEQVVRDLVGPYRSTLTGSDPAAALARPPSAAPGTAGNTGRFSAMNIWQLLDVDLDQIPESELRAYNTRMSELGG
jgi:hypothetical protein